MEIPHVEQKAKKIEFSENKIRLLDSVVIEEMNELRLNEISSKIKRDSNIDRLKNSLTKITSTWKKTIELKFFNESIENYVLIMIYL